MEATTFFAMGAFETFLPVQMENFGWDPFTIGLIMAVQIAAMIIIKPLSGSISDNWKRKPIIFLGLIMSALSFFLLASLQDNIPIYYIGSILFGIGVATTTSSTAALVSDLSLEKDVGSAIGTLSSIMDIGHSLGPLITGFLINFLGFLTSYTFIALFLVLGAFFFLFTVEPPFKKSL